MKDIIDKGINVFVSCPMDVEKEKQEICTICRTLTEANTGMNLPRFNFRDWKEYTGYIGERNQAQLNKFIGSYDIYIGIWWKRIGMKPGSQSLITGLENESGSEEEFDIALNEFEINKNPKIYLFFKDYDLEIKAKDNESRKKEIEQLNKVFLFQDRINKLLPNKDWITKYKAKSEFSQRIIFILTRFQNELLHELKVRQESKTEESLYTEKVDSLCKKATLIFLIYSNLVKKSILDKFIDGDQFGTLLYLDFIKVKKEYVSFDERHLYGFVSKNLSRINFYDLIRIVSENNKLYKGYYLFIKAFYNALDAQDDLLLKLNVWLFKYNSEAIIEIVNKDKVELKFREEFLIEKYKDFKNRDIWIYPNFYSNEELAEFGESDVTYKFLVSELNVSEQDRIPLINALILIGYFKNLGSEKKEELKSILIKLLAAYYKDKDIVQNIITVFNRQDITDNDLVICILKLVSTNKNEWVRTSMYRIISSTNIADDVFEYLMEGIKLLNTKGDPEREDNNLIDEQIQLCECFKKVQETGNLIILIDLIKSMSGHEIGFYYDDIIEAVINNSTVAYSKEPKIIKNIIDLYISRVDRHNLKEIDIVKKFFDYTTTKKEAISIILKRDFDFLNIKSNALAFLLEHDNIEYLSEVYQEGGLDLTLLKYLSNDIFYMKEDLIDNFFDLFNNRLELGLIKPVKRDSEKIKRIKNQAEFDLLFDIEKFKEIIIGIFSRFGKDSINKSDLLALKKENWSKVEYDESISIHAIDKLMNFSGSENMIMKNSVDDWLEDDKRVELYLINEIYNELKSKKDLTVSVEQNKKIYNWCERNFETVDFTKAIFKEGGQLRYRLDAIFMSYFYRRFKYDFPEDIMLDMLSFDYFTVNDYSETDDIISKLPADKVKERIERNIIEGISDFNVLKNHVMYALENNIESTYEYILSYTRNFNVESYEANELIKMYFEKTKDAEGLYHLLRIPEDINWKVVELLIPVKESVPIQKSLEEYLSSSHNDKDKKFIASQYLIRMQSRIGMDYFIGKVKQMRSIDLSHLNCLKNIDNPDLISGMFELLEFSYEKEIKIDPFYNLNKIVLDSLFSIAMKSKALYDLVRGNLMKFQALYIEKYPDLKFLKYDLDNMDKRFRELYVHVPDIEEVKAILKELGF
ncbi:MAG: hypothetical protein RBS89_03110 [Candidatus Delongbacteria bacterium]|jgi:hypothetical protein|nr:hypothetical protein [Candidatus Delongbacteria bacterium]